MFISGGPEMLKMTSTSTSTKKTERFSKKIGKIIISIFLPVGFILATIFSRWPFYYLVTFPLRILNAIDFIFLVYPGKTKDIEKYCPLWLARTFIFKGKPTFAGMITRGKSEQRGLYLVVPELIREILEENKIMDKIMKSLSKFSNLLGKNHPLPIAMAGRLPSAAKKHGFSVKSPFVNGIRGTVFSIIATFEEAMKKHNLEVGKFNVVLVGVGHVGEPLIDTLKILGHNVSGIDKKISERKDVFLPDAGAYLISSADVIIILTAEGEDFDEYSQYVKYGAVILDDTHPRLPEEKVPQGAILHKVVVYQEGSIFVPSLSGFKGNEVVGCCVEAGTIAYAIKKKTEGENDPYVVDQIRFNSIAEEAGFYAQL